MGSLHGPQVRIHSLSLKSYKGHQLTDTARSDFIYKSILLRKLTYLYRNEGDQVTPASIGKGETLLVRKLPIADPKHVSVGDLVVLKNPEKADNYLVRRLTAIEGYEMVSTDDKDEPFVLEKDQCWVEAENKSLKPKEAKDSRSFGPVNITDIVGRVLYRLRTCVDHGCVRNSHSSMLKDWPVLAVELDVEEMSKNHKA
ncbi:Mitochondrial inner membrane protease subunit 1 [Spatholobus suberectus]|nr:Mitochondrial inner membrane protease subunit 1 [Spatholobus suberectus]